jgi:hypothetical protein
MAPIIISEKSFEQIDELSQIIKLRQQEENVRNIQNFNRNNKFQPHGYKDYISMKQDY